MTLKKTEDNEGEMGVSRWNLPKVVCLSLLVCLIASVVITPAMGQEVWTVRGDFAWVLADDDLGPVDNLYGASFDLLYDVSAHIRIGGEAQWVTGNRGGAAADCIFLFSLFEITFWGDYVENYDVYVNLAIGGVYADTQDVSGISDEAIDVAGRPAIGLDLFLSEHVALNIQAGYLLGRVTLDGREVSTSGFEGKMGLAVIF